MATLVTKVRQAIERYGLFAQGERVIVAVSGGPDSTALLLALAALAPEYGLSLIVAHLNHMFRGAQAEADARWVEELARRLGVPFAREDADVPALIRQSGMTVEQAGREARYRFYERLARRTGATKVAVGQTLDDQAETVLLHLVRGAGLTGIAGIRPLRRAPYGYVVRPLLWVTRAETEAYCAAHGLKPRHDPYNDDPHYLRNRIRRAFLPWLAEEANPRIKEVLAQSAAIWQEEEDYLQAAAAAAYRKAACAQRDGVGLKAEELEALPPALRRRVLRLAYAAVSPAGVKDLGFTHTEALLDLAGGGAGRVLDLPHGVRAERHPDYLRLTRVPPAAAVPPFSYPLVVPGVTIIPELDYAVHTFFADDGDRASSAPVSLVASAVFDYNEAGPRLFARNWRRGDWFCPRGLGGRKKLSDFFIDAKIPRSERSRILLIATARDIIWVAGLREDARFVAGPGTARRIHIEVHRTDSGTKEGDTDEQH
ncbi:tRNA lysidine(34) synthetase TilS [Gelria sp. Kuro-4]|uniref:tRNA lysidine(34) synthetase TilS n=1 Tax=Gelria sp. Kuro-4 TaxID=2796927 RepID=UPI001BEFF1D6|nr:tRNA lysidine(34) synthetase TilS [Gelria sp. Kuro-4]BCV23406.1 tRNA(Ile)-lysidine synthase [Gelria sp. Kuro-4]